MGGTVYDDQHLLDLAFNDLEHLLLDKEQVDLRNCLLCAGCGGTCFSYSGSDSSYPGSRVCDLCGVVESGCVFFETMYGADVPKRSSNYKRIHHWHERISQLLLLESEIPFDHMLRIAEKLCDGTYTSINKDIVREVLRSLNMQTYIEKWLQIIYRVTHIAPPKPGTLLVQKLDQMFQDLQEPFVCYRLDRRKNFLNYNYVFCRLFQRLYCTQFCMFFPLIKSKQKLKQLDDMWIKMAECVKWKVEPLISVQPFAVRIEQPSLLLQRLASEYVPPIRVEPQTMPLRMVFRTLGHRSAEKMLLSSRRRRSDQPVRGPRKVAAAKRKSRSILEANLRSSSRRRFPALRA